MQKIKFVYAHFIMIWLKRYYQIYYYIIKIVIFVDVKQKNLVKILTRFYLIGKLQPLFIHKRLHDFGAYAHI